MLAPFLGIISQNSKKPLHKEFQSYKVENVIKIILEIIYFRRNDAIFNRNKGS